MNNKTLLAAALGIAVMGGVAYAAYNSINFSQNIGSEASSPQIIMPMTVDAGTNSTGSEFVQPAVEPMALAPAASSSAAVVAAPMALAAAKPATAQKQYATITDIEPITKAVAQSTPRQVCENVTVQQRAPERDGNVGGTVAGVLIGGLVGNQVGGGDGRKAATAAGAIAGGYIGNRVDRNHVGGRTYSTTERQCHTVTDRTSTSKTVGYLVSYREPDGSNGTIRMNSRPKGSRLPMRNGVVSL